MQTTSSIVKPIQTLSVEDNTADQWLIADMFQKSDRTFNLTFVSNGETAIDYLHQKGEHASRPRPDVILLDLNLPRKDGFEVLKEIRENEALRNIPVLVLTTSEAQQDISKCKALGADLFIVKPANLDGFQKVLKDIETFCNSRLP